MADSIRVLHVDDEPDFADMAAIFLERFDDRLEVETLTNAEEGINRVKESAIDCVVSDYDMPGKSGIDFLSEIRELSDELPFILYTGKGSEEIAGEAISTGVTDYIQKQPGTSQYKLLVNRIDNSVAQYRAGQAIKEAEMKLSLIAEKTDDILFLVDSEWTELQFVNSAYEKVWGESVEDLKRNPRSFLDKIHPADVDRVEAIFERILNGKPTAVQYRILTDGDNVRWMYSEGKPVYEDGEFTRIVGTVRDITDQKVREEKLQSQISERE